MLYISRIIWDDQNRAHIARHDVTDLEVEEVCNGKPVSSETYGGRIRVVGPTVEGRMLTVVLAPKGKHIYYAVTARPASRKERLGNQNPKGGEKAA